MDRSGDLQMAADRIDVTLSMRDNWLVLEANSKVSALEVLPKTDEDKFEIMGCVVSS